jgi:hypothetical protein
MKPSYFLSFLIIFTIFLILTVFGFKYKEVSEYKNLENNLKKASQKYVKKEIDKDVIKKLYLSIDDLKPYLTEDFKVKKEKCTGYVMVSKKFLVLIYTPFIKCDKYKTKNYKNM